MARLVCCWRPATIGDEWQGKATPALHKAPPPQVFDSARVSSDEPRNAPQSPASPGPQPGDRAPDDPAEQNVALHGAAREPARGTAAGSERRLASCLQGAGRSHSAPLQEPLHDNRRYRKLRDLSRSDGAFVQLAIDTSSNSLVTVTFVERGRDFCGDAVKNMLVAQRLFGEHPHLLKMQDVFLTPGFLAIASEYADLGSLRDYMDRCSRQGQLTEAIAQRLFLQLLTALEFRRTMGASQDFLVDDVLLATSPPTKADGDGVPTIKTASWLAQERASLGCTARALRPELLPPEVLAAAGGADEPATAGSIAAQDAWTLGVALHLMLTGRGPFDGEGSMARADPAERRQTLMRLMAKGRIAKPSIPVSDGCWALLLSMLAADPAARPSLARIAQNSWVRVGSPRELLRLNDDLLSKGAPTSCCYDGTTADNRPPPANGTIQAVRWARNTRLLVAMVRQCSAEAELAQTEV